jgi:hypothetical protein
MESIEARSEAAAIEAQSQPLAALPPLTPLSQPAPPGWLGRARDQFWEYWEALRIRSLLWMVNALVLGALALMLFPRLLDDLFTPAADSHLAIDPHFALLVLCACAAPPLLARLCHSLIDKKAAMQRICLDFPATVEPSLAKRAVSCWLYEINRNHGSLTRAESFAGLWGLMTTLVLVGAVTFLLPPFHTPRTAFTSAHNMVAFAVVGATSTRFLLDLARICVRISNDDASKRMFAETLRALILSIVATLAFMLISGLLESKAPGAGASGLTGVLQSMGMGAGVAIVGVPAFEYVVQKLSALLGITRPQQPVVTPLAALAGINAAEIDRLAEEGIDSVECLVSTPLPRIFLNTRFSLQRISDWFDKGLLLCRLGTVAAADLRGRAGLTGALELKQIAGGGSDPRAAAVVDAVKKAMRIESDDEARLVVSAVVFDDAVVMLGVLRQTPLADPSAIDDVAALMPQRPRPVDAGAPVLHQIRS